MTLFSKFPILVFAILTVAGHLWSSCQNQTSNDTDFVKTEVGQKNSAIKKAHRSNNLNTTNLKSTSAPKTCPNRATTAHIIRAQKAIKNLRGINPQIDIYKDYKIQLAAIQQPEFTGTVKEQGCIAVFRNRMLKAAITTKAFDYLTQKAVPVREYTTEELEINREQLTRYYNQKMTQLGQETPTIVILSQSFQLCTSEALLDLNEQCHYHIESEIPSRGGHITVFRDGNKSKIRLCSELIYR